MKICITLLFVLASYKIVSAQSAEIRSLQQKLSSVKDSTQYVDILNRIGTLSSLKSNDSCFLYAVKAKAVADRIDYIKGKAGALKNLGISYTGKNNYLSMAYANESLSLFTSLNDSMNMCQLLNNLGSVNYDSKIGIDYYYKAYALGSKLSKDSVLSLVISNIITKDTALAKAKKEELFSKGLSIAYKYNNQRMILFYKSIEAEWLYKAGKKKEAIDLFNSSAKEADLYGYELMTMNNYTTLGDLLMKDSAETALPYYEEALRLSTKTDYLAYTSYVAQKLYDFYIAKKNTEKAVVYSTILLKEYNKNEAALQKSGFTYMNYVLKEKELGEARVRDGLKKNVIIILGILIIVSLFSIFFIYRSYKTKHKLSAALQNLNDAALEKNITLQTNNSFNNKLLSIIAHDLRQPFASVIMLAGMLDTDEPFTTEDVKYVLKKMAIESGKSIQFMDGLLKWMKLQMNGFEYRPQQLNLGNIIHEAIDFYQQPAAEKNVKVKGEFFVQQMINADREMLLFITRNFLSNAIKFSPSGADIKIESSVDKNEIVVAFKDAGKGMTAKEMAHLFRYADNAANTKGVLKGAGIALVICYDMMEKMNGRIWAESEPNQGSTFYYALPV